MKAHSNNKNSLYKVQKCFQPEGKKFKGLGPDDGGSKHLRNVGEFPLDYKTHHHRTVIFMLCFELLLEVAIFHIRFLSLKIQSKVTKTCMKHVNNFSCTILVLCDGKLPPYLMSIKNSNRDSNQVTVKPELSLITIINYIGYRYQ
jgi:hypothetical protein